MNEQQTITFELILRLKRRIVDLKTRLSEMSRMKDKLLKIDDRLNNQNESNADIVVHVNVEINETFTRLSIVEERVEQMM